jgi:aspartate ammonia-lyase
MAHTRIEHDFLGDREIPNDKYYGIQTLRAIENFQITGIPISHSPVFIKAFAKVKKACAQTNEELKVLDPKISKVIQDASDAIIKGDLIDQFPVDVIQGGAGTSTNMNVNEVIANKALELLGEPKGTYNIIHPNNHVNCSQSTNDTYPTAFRLALHHDLNKLIKALRALEAAFAIKGEEFKDILKMGRTQLQDAVPMALGDEFTAFSVTLDDDVKCLKDARNLLLEMNLGATAIGTTINAPEGYPELSIKKLANITGLPLFLAPNLIEQTSDTGAYVQISGVLKRVATKLSKICNDLRLLSSGPRAGFNEINLPQMQPGSSIMPGKVNPVIPEVVNQVCYLVIGNDITITMAAEAGQLQLNVMEPVISYAIFQSTETLTNSIYTLIDKCVIGITANEDVCAANVANSVGVVTALNPVLGYEKCSEIAKEAFRTGKRVYDIVLEKGWIDKEKLDRIFDPENLKNPKFIK